MYTELQRKTNRPVERFADWAFSFGAWLDTPDGLAWIDEQADAFDMAISADRYNEIPGVWSC